MIVQYCSDLHLEFDANRKWLAKNPLIPKGEILIIAGDTFLLDLDFKSLEFLKIVADQFEQVFLIPGNHEYYGGFSFENANSSMYEAIYQNMFMINNKSLLINDTTFIFSTMWSNIVRNPLMIKQRMTDFHRIRVGSNLITINKYNDVHEASFQFLRKEVETHENKKVIVTHHLPSIQCNVDEYKDSELNDAFCVDKTHFIEKNNIQYWIYGHSHRNKKSFKIGQTELLTNQLGYVKFHEHLTFNSSKTFSI